jgi:hypothetical protein
MGATLSTSTARRHRNWSSTARDCPFALDQRRGTLDSRHVRRSRKPWIGVLVAICVMGPEVTVGESAVSQVPPPVAGQTVNAKLISGTVRYKVPGASAFVDLTDQQQVPLGTTFDTTGGRVTLTSASDAQGATQHAWFYEGTFKVGQTTGDQPVTTLTLAGTQPSCGSARAAAKRKSRHLWGDGKGRFRTAGLFSAATVRGTRWVVVDRCDGTLTRVVRGVVAVRDFARHTTVLVRAGHEYLAKATR